MKYPIVGAISVVVLILTVLANVIASGASYDAAADQHGAAAEVAGNAMLDPDALAVVGEFHAALASGDPAQVMRLLTPDVIVLEGGNVERSRQEYAGHHLPADLDFMRAMSYRLERQAGASGVDFAWVVSEGSLTGRVDGRQTALASMETLVLRRSEGRWRIAHIHWSSRPLAE